jgi:hypothetical protein
VKAKSPLKEVFWLAKIEERYKNGKLGKNPAPKLASQPIAFSRQTHIHACVGSGEEIF